MHLRADETTRRVSLVRVVMLSAVAICGVAVMGGCGGSSDDGDPENGSEQGGFNGGTAEDRYVVNSIMPNSRIVARIRPRVAVTLDLATLSSTTAGTSRTGDFVVYRRPATTFDETSYDGYYERGSQLPGDLGIVLAWKNDGTAYLGTEGADASALAAVVEGWGKMMVSTEFRGCLLESGAYRLETKRLLGNGALRGFGASVLDDWALFDQLETEFFNRFDRPVYRVASALYMQGIRQSKPPSAFPAMVFWSPRSSWATGSASRSFRLSVSGVRASYVVAVANCDNGNSSSVTLDGTKVVSNDHCCENYWRGPRDGVSQVRLETRTSWSQGAPMINLAFVANSVSASDPQQTPAGGLSNNRAPIVSVIPPSN